MPKPHRAICIYMMKKALFMLAMLTCIFASCSDGGSDEPSNPTPKPEEVKSEITLDNGIVTNGLSFGVAQGEQSVSFTTNTNWTLSIAATTSGSTWCKASATSGSKGTANVKFTVTENTDYDDRSVSVTIKAGTASKTFTITQKGADALLVTTKKYEVAQAGGKIEVEVKANIEYQLAVSETAKDWIKETQSKSRALTTKKHTFEIAENEEVEKREGEITIKSGDKVETVKVYQAGGAVLLLSKNEFTVSDAGETISVDIKNNVEYGVQMPDVDWIKDEASNRGMSSHTLKYVIAPNEGYDSRSAEIIFYDQNSDLKDTLKVVQAQKDAIVISQKNISVDKEGGTIEVKVNTNVDFEVQIPTEATWITQTESRALTEKSIYLKVEENIGDESRSVNITITNKKSQLSETIVVTQHGDMLIIKLEKSGFLNTFLEKEEGPIKYLKIIGTLNGEDINGLKDYDDVINILDLSEATISGGKYYHYRDYGYDHIPVEENVITRGLFDFRINELILPRNIIQIKKSAIAVEGGLNMIDLPKTLKTIENPAFDSDAWSGPTYAPKCINISDLEAWCKIPLEGGIFERGGILSLNGTPITELNIPKSITKVGDYSFYSCRSIKNINIHENIDSIGNSSFYRCDSLISVKMSDGLKAIGSLAFANCSNLTTIEFSNSLTTISEHAFSGCVNLQTIELPNSTTNIEYGAFWNCTSLQKLSLPENLTKLRSEVFSDCKKLTELILKKNIESIGNDNFNNSPLTAVYCYATNPPNIEPRSFKKSSTCKLYVPKGCKAAYESSKWNDYFYEINEMN